MNIPPSAAAILGIVVVGLLFALLARRPYRGPLPTDDRPRVFVFSRVWLVGIYLLAAGFLVGPYAFPDSPAEQAKNPWVWWLTPTLAVLLVSAAEYMRRAMRVEVYGSFFRFKHRGAMIELRFATVGEITVTGTTVIVRLHSGETHLLSIGYGGTGQMLALLRTKIAEARYQPRP